MTPSRRGGILKVLLLLVVLVVLLVVGGFIAVGVYIDSIAKSAIERGGTYALGVPTTLDSADVGLLSARFDMSGLRVANPSGYSAAPFLALGSGGVAVSPSTLNQSTIELPELTLRAVSISLEKKDGAANYSVILDNLKKVTGSGDSKPTPAPSSGDQTRYIVQALTIENVSINVDLLEAPEPLRKAARVRIPIEKIELRNVGKTGSGVGGTGVTMSELAAIVVQAVLAAASEKGAGILPEDLLNDLKGRLASLDGLKDVGMSVVADAKMLADEAKKQLDDATNKAKDAVEKGKDAIDEGKKKLDEIGKGLEGLIPKKKPGGG